MSTDASHPHWVKLDQALDLVMAQRGEAVIPVTAGDTSMVPHLRGGDAVLVVPCAGPPAAGDLLLFRQNDYFVVHRFLGAATTSDGRKGLRTRGDGRNVLDPLVAAESVRARVVALRRGGAWRTLEGLPARAYARLMAWHALFWAAAGIAGRKVGLGRAVAAADLMLLRLLVPMTFPAAHRQLAGQERLVE